MASLGIQHAYHVSRSALIWTRKSVEANPDLNSFIIEHRREICGQLARGHDSNGKR